jgi:hypothetical protein
MVLRVAACVSSGQLGDVWTAVVCLLARGGWAVDATPAPRLLPRSLLLLGFDHWVCPWLSMGSGSHAHWRGVGDAGVGRAWLVFGVNAGVHCVASIGMPGGDVWGAGCCCPCGCGAGRIRTGDLQGMSLSERFFVLWD